MAAKEKAVEARAVIRKPRAEVFGFYRDFRNLPRFLGDVMAVEQVDPTASRWTVQGPLGVRLAWTVRVTEERTNELISYETVSLPLLRTYWEIHFAPGPQDGETEVREVMKAPLGGLGRAVLAVIRKCPDKEVAADLNRLKELMETGRVTDTSFAVAGKFGRRAH
jgi:uncharacterized membrane protein